MADPSKQTEQEPSIEEILNSIRQIISDDEDESDSSESSESKDAPAEFGDDFNADRHDEVNDPFGDSYGRADDDEDDEDPIILTNRVDPDDVALGAADEESEQISDDSLDDVADDFSAADNDESAQDLADSRDFDDFDVSTDDRGIVIDMKEPDESVEEDFADDDDVGVDKGEELLGSTDFDDIPADKTDETQEILATQGFAAQLGDDEEGDALLTKRAEDAAVGAFKKLAAKTAVDNISGITIEEIVRDEIRPMLRAWLDQNLPPLMERLLKEELDRVARRALEE